MHDRYQLFGAVLGSIQAELDWERLGRAYCEGDGSSFFDEALRERWLDCGLTVADALAGHLSSGSGRSVYVGAALAELPILLVESIVLAREVVWINVACDEIDELERVVRIVAARFEVALPLPSLVGIELLPRAAFDHVWLVSVLTDPDHFPALHDELYERHGTELATGRGDLRENRQRAETLANSVLDLAAPDALLSTTAEELTVLSPLCLSRSVRLRVLGPDLESSIVGDTLTISRLEAIEEVTHGSAVRPT